MSLGLRLGPVPGPLVSRRGLGPASPRPANGYRGVVGSGDSIGVNHQAKRWSIHEGQRLVVARIEGAGLVPIKEEFLEFVSVVLCGWVWELGEDWWRLGASWTGVWPRCVGLWRVWCNCRGLICC